MIGAVFALRGGLPGHLEDGRPTSPPPKGRPRCSRRATRRSRPRATPARTCSRTIPRPSKVKVVNNEEQPVDLNAQTARRRPLRRPRPPLRRTARARDRRHAGVVMPPQPAPGALPRSPSRSRCARSRLRPDGTPIPNSVADAGRPAARRPASRSRRRRPPKRRQDAGGRRQRASLDAAARLPTKLPPKSSARVVVAKTDTTAPGGRPNAGERPPAKPEKPVEGKPQEAAAEPARTPAAAEPRRRRPTLGVQLAAPRSEAEAKGVVSKLDAKYASALGGSALGVHKATVNGDAIYRVRVTRLSKADAASLCARIKGDGGDCFVAK